MLYFLLEGGGGLICIGQNSELRGEKGTLTKDQGQSGRSQTKTELNPSQ